jgi:pyruvate ferredoxin oxidoreductase alpha subunit
MQGMEVSHAVSEGVKLANVDVIAAYPITPQTHIVERLAQMIADGELLAEYINVESEHSAMSACIGAAAVGARAFTATSSQGLALMHELLFIASGLRMPIAMVVANRALSAPINIWCDHSDIMAERDCGWIQIFVENGQEAFDQTICAFKIAESTYLPVMVNLDGFILTHMIEPIELLSQADVEKFLPKFKPKFKLDPKNPICIGGVGTPEIYFEIKKQQDSVLRDSKSAICKIWDEFAQLSRRFYAPIKSYKTEDAEILILTMGAIGGTARTAINKLRAKGKKIGLLSLRLFRPFPFEELREAVKNASSLAVVDRSVSYGGPGGPVFSEIRSALFDMDLKIYGFILGLGGRDIKIEDFEAIVEIVERGELKNFEFIGVREC